MIDLKKSETQVLIHSRNRIQTKIYKQNIKDQNNRSAEDPYLMQDKKKKKKKKKVSKYTNDST